MKKVRMFLLSAIFAIVGCSSAVTAENTDTGNHWLNGDWVGSAPTGGEMTLTLRVVKNGEVEGKAVVRILPNYIRGNVSGTVTEDNKITLEIKWRSSTTMYHLSPENGGQKVLTGKAGRSGQGKDLYFEKKN